MLNTKNFRTPDINDLIYIYIYMYVSSEEIFFFFLVNGETILISDKM